MIEKNIRLEPHQSKDLLVGRRSDGKRPKYQPPGYGSSSARDSGSRGGGGPPGGGDRQMTYSAPAPTPEPTPSPHLGGADDGGWTRAFESPTNVTGDTPEERLEKEFLETGDIDVLSDLIGFDTAPKVGVKDIMGEVDDPGSVSYDPTIEQQKTILEDPRVDEGFKRYIRQVQQPTVSTDRTGLMQSFMDTSPKIDVKDAIGRGVFNVGLKKLGLGMLNPFLGLASLFTRGKTPRSAYDLAKNLKSNIRTPSSNIIDKRTSAIDTKPDREGGDGPRVKTVAEQVATGQGLESGAKLLGVQNTQKAELFKRRSIVEDILRKGSYQGRDLTSGQRNTLMNYISQIDKYLVAV